MIEQAESQLISTTPGAVPPHLDDGGHLPFGGLIGGTRGPSAFGKRKMTRANAIGNPQALLLNYPPEDTEATLKCWERNCARPVARSSPHGDLPPPLSDPPFFARLRADLACAPRACLCAQTRAPSTWTLPPRPSASTLPTTSRSAERRSQATSQRPTRHGATCARRRARALRHPRRSTHQTVWRRQSSSRPPTTIGSGPPASPARQRRRSNDRIA